MIFGLPVESVNFMGNLILILLRVALKPRVDLRNLKTINGIEISLAPLPKEYLSDVPMGTAMGIILHPLLYNKWKI